MLLAALAAWWLPFETFALAYVVLGPLHYLTQLSWLADRGFFLKSRRDVLWFVPPCVAISFGLGLDQVFDVDWRAMLILGCLAAGGVLAFAGHWAVRVAGVLAGLGLGALAWVAPGVALLALFVPTLIHVFVFTNAFMLRGALRRRSASEGLAVLAHIGFAVALVVGVGGDGGGYAATPEAASTLEPFVAIRRELGSLLGLGATGDEVLALMRFLAFAYTFHYLNWFSKTRVIRWHEVSKARLAAIVALYIACLAAYAIDYEVGFIAVGFVGMLHVFTEFPLDIRTFVDIPRALLAPRKGA